MRRLFTFFFFLVLLALSPWGQAVQGIADREKYTPDYGISPQVELLYSKGLKFLKSSQKEDGTFEGKYGDDPATVSFCLISILAHGDETNTGGYSDVVRRSIDFILSRQDSETGYIGSSMYSHGFATLALAECYGHVRDERIGKALQKAVILILDAQKKNPLGAWRYTPLATDADTSVSGCQIVALFAARNAGIPVSDEAFSKAAMFMRSCRTEDGEFGYTAPEGGRVALTAIGALCEALSGNRHSASFKQTTKRLIESLDYKSPDFPFYFEYYMSQALFQADEAAWRRWNHRNIMFLANAQNVDGSWTGAYSPAYSTGLFLLSLAINFKLLPIYEK